MTVSVKIAATGLLDQMIFDGELPKGTRLLASEPLPTADGCSSSWKIHFRRPDGSEGVFQMDVSLPETKLH